MFNSLHVLLLHYFLTSLPHRRKDITPFITPDASMVIHINVISVMIILTVCTSDSTVRYDMGGLIAINSLTMKLLELRGNDVG